MDDLKNELKKRNKFFNYEIDLEFVSVKDLQKIIDRASADGLEYLRITQDGFSGCRLETGDEFEERVRLLILRITKDLNKLGYTVKRSTIDHIINSL